MRAVAALLVVYEHSMDVQMKFGKSWEQNIYHLKGFGCIGVDLFFVISGFIITYVANRYRGIAQGFQFLEKRFYRINPVYYIATILCLGVYLLQLNVNHTSIDSTFRKTMSSLLDSLLIFPTSGDIDFFVPLLIVGWTLSFEWLFYIFFFFLILCNIKRKAIYLSSLILLLIGTGQLLQSEDLRLQFITNPIMLEFVLGVIICQLYLNNIKIPSWMAAAGLAAGLISYGLLIRFGYGNVWYYLDTISGKASLNKFLLWGLPSGCIVTGCVSLEKNGKLSWLFNNRWSLLLGDASYSLYLIHYIVLNALFTMYFKTKFFLNGDAMIWLQLIVATIISVVFYKLIETPLLKLMHKHSIIDKLITSNSKVESAKKKGIIQQAEPVIS
ncbi:hypothetical protein A3860_36600 [Niastella vici]|uniref:Acyltransferase 3 domain-containing protein n=1 Tax=Niastella vici TaxID=1703345 RepID=A0A1V9FMX3_9BACT|nr:hypothetical protein A3860_36600 [Niastella vici]